MLNIRKRFFLLLTIVGLLFSFASCTKKNDYVEVKIEASEYVIVIGETIDVIPTINKGESVKEVELVYVSQNDKIATYSNGKVTGVSEGQTVVKAYVANKAIAYDTVLITVIQDRLPGMEFSGAEGSILKGTTSQVKCKFTPASASENVALTYASSNPEVAIIDANGLINNILDLIPTEEYVFIKRGIIDAIQSIYEYDHSVFGIIDTIKSDYDNLDLNASNI